MENFKNYNILTEIFNSHLELKHEPSWDTIMKSQNPNLEQIKTYSVTHKDTPYMFLNFKHNGAHEVHFNRMDSDSGTDKLNKHKGSATSELIGTAFKLYKDKLNNGQKIRYYGDNKELNDLYHKSFNYINKKHFNNNLEKLEIPNYKCADGETRTAYEIQHKKGDKND